MTDEALPVHGVRKPSAGGFHGQSEIPTPEDRPGRVADHDAERYHRDDHTTNIRDSSGEVRRNTVTDRTL